MTKAVFPVILDLKKEKRNMTLVTESLTEKLHKTIEESNTIANEVEGIYIFMIYCQGLCNTFCAIMKRKLKLHAWSLSYHNQF